MHAEIEDDGESRKLTLEEIVAFVQLIGSAGTETVARLLGFARGHARASPTSVSCSSTSLR